MNKSEQIKVGSVVQISPDSGNKLFAGCFLLVTEIKSWGMQGYVSIPQSRDELPGAAYYRPRWEEVEYIGEAAWIPVDDAEESDRT